VAGMSRLAETASTSVNHLHFQQAPATIKYAAAFL